MPVKAAAKVDATKAAVRGIAATMMVDVAAVAYYYCQQETLEAMLGGLQWRRESLCVGKSYTRIHQRFSFDV